MGKRHDAIGIKQVVRLEWYDYALDMLILKSFQVETNCATVFSWLDHEEPISNW